MGVSAAVGEAANVRVSSGGISPGGTKVGVATETTVAPGGASMVGLAIASAEGSVVGLGRVQPPTTMMATTTVRVNAIAADGPLLMACLL